MINLFKKIKKNDWVFSSWRNHYHALLKGCSAQDITKQIVSGRSMTLNSIKNKFFTSSIVGGIIPIALGVAFSLKKKIKNTVWVFIGDMTYETGVFHECYKFSRNFKLPLKFIVEDNGLNTNTPTNKAWGKNKKNYLVSYIIHIKENILTTVLVNGFYFRLCLISKKYKEV